MAKTTSIRRSNPLSILMYVIRLSFYFCALYEGIVSSLTR